MSEPFIKIALLENSIEAALVSATLKQSQIPHRMTSYQDTAYDGLFQLQKGWGAVYAPLTYQIEIIKIINDIRQKHS